MKRAGVRDWALAALAAACVEEPATDSAAEVAAPDCPAPSFVSAGMWLNEELPTAIVPVGRDPGVGVGDLDGDGDDDMLYGWAGNTQLFLGDGAGGLTLGPPLEIDGAPADFSRAVALSDFDDDGDLDVVLGHDSAASDQLLLNDGSGFRYDAFPLPDSTDTTWTASLADFDGDGRTDVYTATYSVPFDVDLITGGSVIGSGHAFWFQRDAGAWERQPVPAEVDAAVSLQGSVLDADGDGRLDLYMVNDFGPYVLPNRLLHNDGGRFSVAKDCACDLSIYSMGGGVGDADGDGWPDLVVTDIGSPHLLLNDGTGAFYDAGQRLLPALRSAQRMTSWGSALADLDLDGDDDVVLAYGSLGPNGSPSIGTIANTDPSWTEEDDQYSSVLVNGGEAGFSLLPEAAFDELSRSRVVAVANLDGDARPDLVVAGRKRIQAWRNTGGCEEGVALRLRGPPGSAGAFGARVEAEVAGRASTRWYLPSTTGSQSTDVVFVGLGGAPSADRIVVTWPDGEVTTVEDVPAGPLLLVEG